MTTTPGYYDITIYQGATFLRSLIWKDENAAPINLTGMTARLQMRASLDAQTPFLTLTTENGRITLGGTAGTILLSISATDTAALTDSSGLYDLELVSSGGIVTRLLEGAVLVRPEVTR